SGGKKTGWFGSLTSMPARSRLRQAKRAGEHRKVLDDGEELLTRLPGDVATQLDMAEAAEAMKLAGLGIWLLGEARQDDGNSVPVLRMLARLYETHQRFPQAIALWERVKKIDPSDPEAPRKINEIAVNDTLARGRFLKE